MTRISVNDKLIRMLSYRAAVRMGRSTRLVRLFSRLFFDVKG